MSKIYASRTGVAEEAKVYVPFGGAARELKKAYQGNAQGIAELIFEKQSGAPFELISYSGTMELVEYETGKWYARLLSDGELVTNGGTADVFMAGGGGMGAMGQYTGTGVCGIGGGGGGGYTLTLLGVEMPVGVSVVIGYGGYRVSGKNNGGVTEVGALSSDGGKSGVNGTQATAGINAKGGKGGDGGSGGCPGVGASDMSNRGTAGSDGSNGVGPGQVSGIGQGTTTYAFEGDVAPFDTLEFLFSGGGGGGTGSGTPVYVPGGEGGGGDGGAWRATGGAGIANTGGGGGSGGGGTHSSSNRINVYGGSGGSGIAIIRWGNW